MAHLPNPVHLHFELVCLADSKSHRIYSERNTWDWWWDTHKQLSTGGLIVAVICASDKTHLINFLGDQHTTPLYCKIGNFWKHNCCTPKKRAWILVGLILYFLDGTKNIDEGWNSMVDTVLSHFRNLDITGTGLKWDCANGFHWQC